jgi:hypothetical protein
MKRQCSNCEFHDDGEGYCRRYAPRMLYPKKKWLDIHNSELLRTIAWAVSQAAQIDQDYDMNFEATECSSEPWPQVKPNDWCGEFKIKETP